MEWGTDHFDFMLEGVPTFVADQEEANYLENYHAISDTYDKVDFPQLKKHVAEAAALSVELADLPTKIGPRLTHDQIEQTMRDTNSVDMFKAFGIWDEWVSGQRGRAEVDCRFLISIEDLCHEGFNLNQQSEITILGQVACPCSISGFSSTFSRSACWCWTFASSTGPGTSSSFREALGWSAMYVALAAGFAVLLYFWQGHQVALEFVTGYVLELSLSVDNLFVFLVIFNYFAVPDEQQHRVLFWGVIGALVMRGIFIGAGVGLISRFHWVLYIFGSLLIYSGIRFCVMGTHQIDPSGESRGQGAAPLDSGDHRLSGRTILRPNPTGQLRLYATPLLVVLVVIETTDILFAVDSIPAILAITLNAFVVYTSNVFAILGLRSMYFAVSGLMKVFRFLHYGLAVVLILVGLEDARGGLLPGARSR